MTTTLDVFLRASECILLSTAKLCPFQHLTKNSHWQISQDGWSFFHTTELLLTLSKIVYALLQFILCFFENIIHILICSHLDQVSTRLSMWMDVPVSIFPE